MKIKSLFLTAAVLLTALSACNKEEGQGPDQTSGDDAVVKLQLSFSNDETRAVGAPVAGGTGLVIKDGYLLFANAGDKLERPIQILPTGQTGDNKTTVGLDDLVGATGAYLQEIPATATKLYLVSTLPASITVPPVGDDLAGILDYALALNTQSDATGGVSNVSLFGEGNISPVYGNPDYDAEVDVKVYPIAAHLQVKTITRDAAADNKVVSFQVDAIFMNYFSNSSTVRGVTSDFRQNTAFSVWGPGTDYPTLYNGITYDWDLTGNGLAKASGSTAAAPATSGHVWGYNLYPGQTPHIILALSKVKVDNSGVEEYKDGTADGKTAYYVTVRGFAETNTIEKGKIYSIGAIPVHNDYLTEKPEESDDEFIVKAEITLMPWEEITLTPNEF